jgi:hypothetical protein
MMVVFTANCCGVGVGVDLDPDPDLGMGDDGVIIVDVFLMAGIDGRTRIR